MGHLTPTLHANTAKILEMNWRTAANYIAELQENTLLQRVSVQSNH